MDAPSLWELLDDRLLRDCRVWDLRARRYRLPRQGKEADFFYIDSRDWVMVLAPTLQEQFIMVQQFRCGSAQLSWEFPGGIVDAGEDPVQAAMRELREETGYETDGGRIIGQCNPNPAILNNTCYIVQVEPVRALPGAMDWDPHEELQTILLAKAQLMEWAQAGKLQHALALVALFYYNLQS
jgi:8-oxo-dGTP pyrophosphatase MutT (NUDIX family)